MQGVGGKEAVSAQFWPGKAADIQMQRGQNIALFAAFDPGFDAGMVQRQIAGLPGHMGQLQGKIGSVLARAAAYFQNLAAVCKQADQLFGDGFFVAFAGL